MNIGMKDMQLHSERDTLIDDMYLHTRYIIYVLRKAFGVSNGYL